MGCTVLEILLGLEIGFSWRFGWVGLAILYGFTIGGVGDLVGLDWDGDLSRLSQFFWFCWT